MITESFTKKTSKTNNSNIINKSESVFDIETQIKNFIKEFYDFTYKFIDEDIMVFEFGDKSRHEFKIKNRRIKITDVQYYPKSDKLVFNDSIKATDYHLPFLKKPDYMKSSGWTQKDIDDFLINILHFMETCKCYKSLMESFTKKTSKTSSKNLTKKIELDDETIIEILKDIVKKHYNSIDEDNNVIGLSVDFPIKIKNKEFYKLLTFDWIDYYQDTDELIFVSDGYTASASSDDLMSDFNITKEEVTQILKDILTAIRTELNIK